MDKAYWKILICLLLISIAPWNIVQGKVDNYVNDTAEYVDGDDEQSYLIDTIKVITFGEERTDIITHSDLMRPSLDGSYRSLDDLILECLIYQDAARYKMLPTEESIQRHLMAVQREHNLSMAELQDIFRSSGYTFEEGKEKFGIMSAVGSMLDFKIRSRLIVPEKDIVSYYDANPVYQEDVYQLARTFVMPAEGQGISSLRSEIDQLIATGNASGTLNWSEPFWLKGTDIASARQFICDMQPGDIAIAQESDGGLELIKLVDCQERKKVPLEGRYNEIADILRRPKYEQLFNEYRQELFDNASIITF